MIEKFKQKRLEGKTFYKRKRNPATVNRDLCVLSKIFSLAFDAELIDSNPGRRVRKFRTDTRRTRYLTFDEEARLFEKLEGQERVQRIVAMAINTGMRQGEIFKSHLVRRGSLAKLVPRSGFKNGRDRFVPNNQTIRTMLERLPRISEYVFPSPKTEGRLVDVKFRFDKAKREAGIRNFRFHDLRFSSFYWLLHVPIY
jgi:integrase